MKLIKASVITQKGNYFEVMLPSKKIVCPDCEGVGTELRGGLKGCVISEENLSDPDFCESYFGGDYDVKCKTCSGLNVVDVVDESKLSEKMLDRYHRAIEEKVQNDLESYYEQRHFARGIP